MALTGKAKADYQREYMRKRRGCTAVRPVALDPVMLDPVVRPAVRPEQPIDDRPAGVSPNAWAYIKSKRGGG